MRLVDTPITVKIIHLPRPHLPHHVNHRPLVLHGPLVGRRGRVEILPRGEGRRGLPVSGFFKCPPRSMSGATTPSFRRAPHSPTSPVDPWWPVAPVWAAG